MLNHAVVSRRQLSMALSRPRVTRSLRHVKPSLSSAQTLLICDEPTNTAHLQAALNEFGSVGVIDSDQLHQLAGQYFALAIVSVNSERLLNVLQALRATQGDLPVLVEANEALNSEQFVGVLPRYRAMACHQSELKTLVRLRLAPRAETVRRTIL